MSGEITEVTENDIALSADQVKAQVQRIQKVMEAVMKDNHHYGVIPGCGNKPTLLKPGAEKLMMTFRLAADPQVEDIPTDDGKTFRVVCRITNQATGAFLGAGVGECSSKESKYHWRNAVSQKEYNATPDDMRRVKYGKNYENNQVRTNPADLSNTILKMAKKRALVDAVLTVTAASDIFTQDIEDMPTEVLGKNTVGNSHYQKPAPQGKGNKLSAEQIEMIGDKIKTINDKINKEEHPLITRVDIQGHFKVDSVKDLEAKDINKIMTFLDILKAKRVSKASTKKQD